MSTTKKQCNACYEVRDVSEYFYKDGTRSDGLDSVCKPCRITRNQKTNPNHVIVDGNYAGLSHNLGVAPGHYTTAEYSKVKRAQRKIEEYRTGKMRNRRGQTSFRNEVLARDLVCAVTGTSVDLKFEHKGKMKAVVQAAHIKPYSLCEDGEYDDPNNGIAMRSDVHAAFDTGLFTIMGSGNIVTHPIMWGYYPMHIVTELTPEQCRYLQHHNQWFHKLVNSYYEE